MKPIGSIFRGAVRLWEYPLLQRNSDDKIAIKSLLRRILDRIYWLGGVISAFCLTGLLIVIVMQMVARWFNIIFPGGAEYAGYLMAAASFMAFASALNSGTHIRVGLMLTALGRYRFWGEVLCLSIASAVTTYLAWFAIRMVRMTYQFKELSQGQDATPLWIVQMPVAFGAVILAVCFIDNLVTLLVTGSSPVASGKLEQTAGTE